MEAVMNRMAMAIVAAVLACAGYFWQSAGFMRWMWTPERIAFAVTQARYVDVRVAAREEVGPNDPVCGAIPEAVLRFRVEAATSWGEPRVIYVCAENRNRLHVLRYKTSADGSEVRVTF
jgi:hypothetical protein